MIKGILKVLAKKLAINLEEIRVSHKHKGVRGATSESIIREFLKKYLPPENRVGDGEVIDTKGSISTQLDVIITNSDHPYLNDLKDPGLFIIEGVSCCGEVKTNLSSKDIDTLIQSCITYKNLAPKSQKGSSVYGNNSDINRFVNHRPYFLFAFESQLKIEKINEKLNAYYKQHNTPVVQQIDAVFCLDRGAIINFGDGKGSFQYSTMSKKSVPGLVITKYNGEETLIELMSWLSISMLKITLPSSPLIPYLIGDKPMNPKAT